MFDYSKEPHRDILCIDVRSFYASVECQERGLNPLEAMLVVMSNAENAGGLILAASPMAKKKLGISNVSRKYELPAHPDLIIVPPRMNYYIEKNAQIVEIFREFVADQDLHVYSVDESFLDVTSSHNLFGQSNYQIAKKIQKRILDELGLYVTVGIGSNPFLAKVALDIEAKHTSDMIAEWHYEDVPEKLWKIKDITDVWGINTRMRQQLLQRGITSIDSLAHSDYHYLKSSMGMIGEQLYALSWGIDRSILSDKYVPEEKSYGNSQVLTKDYVKQSEIELVIKEIADQVATRIRRHQAKTCCVSLYVGYSKMDPSGKRGFNRQMKVSMTNNTKELTEHCLTLFRKNWNGEAVRNLGISYSKLVYTDATQLNLFEDVEDTMKQEKLDQIVDTIRSKFGFTSLIHASSTLEGATAVKRSSLVCGHAGGRDGIE